MIVKFTGSEATSAELQEGLIALSNFTRGLRGGNTPFVLELTKDDTGTKLVVQTFRDQPSNMAQPSEVKVEAEETVHSVRRGRKTKAVGTVPAEGAVEQVVQNEQETATSSP